MNTRDTHFLPGLPRVPRGHARNVRAAVYGMPPEHTVSVALFCLLVIPGGLFGWVVGFVLFGRILWRATSSLFDGRVSTAGMVARATWLLAGGMASWANLTLEPLALLGLDLALLGTFLAFGAHLRQLVRARSVRRTELERTLRWGTAGLIAHALLCAWVAFVAGGGSMAITALVLLGSALVVHLPIGWSLWNRVRGFWTERDARVEKTFAKTRLLGVAAVWTPFGTQWFGPAPPGEWRVVAETARVPAAVRFEVTLAGLARLKVRRREAGESGGAALSDPVLASTLVAEGMEAEDLDLLLADCHGTLLPVIHGEGARIEKGVLRLDRWVPEGGAADTSWIEDVLAAMVAAVDHIEQNRLEAQPRTDEVIRQLEEISSRQGTMEQPD